MTQPQHLQALANANAIRLARAELKRKIKAGEVRLSATLRDGIPDYCASMNAEALLRTPKRMHRKVAGRFLAEARISPFQQVGHLTERQRLTLADRVEGWEERKAELAQKGQAA